MISGTVFYLYAKVHTNYWQKNEEEKIIIAMKHITQRILFTLHRIAKRAADPGGQYYRRRKSYRPRRYYKSHRNNNIGNILATKAVVGASALGGGLLALGLANGGLNGISIPNIGIPNIGIPNIGIGIPNLGNIIPAVSLNQNGLQFTWNGR